MSERMRFGIFLAPFHKPGINPTLALQSDLELIQWLDRCGFVMGDTLPMGPYSLPFQTFTKFLQRVPGDGSPLFIEHVRQNRTVPRVGEAIGG